MRKRYRRSCSQQLGWASEFNLNRDKAGHRRISRTVRHQTGRGRNRSLASWGAAMADPSQSGGAVADGRSHSGPSGRSAGGAGRADPVFHPSNGAMTLARFTCAGLSDVGLQQHWHVSRRLPVRLGDDQHTAGDGRGLVISFKRPFHEQLIQRQIRDRLPETAILLLQVPQTLGLGVPPKLIIFDGVLGGARAPHCQERRLQRDRFATTMTILNRSDCFGATPAESEWPARHAHSSACPNA